MLSEEAYRKIDREVAKYPPDQKQSAVMSGLRIAQTELGWLSMEAIEHVANYLEMPPIAAYEKLVGLGFEVEAMYYEPGVSFCGEWNNGEDLYYQIEGNSEWVRENIPEHIDEAFGISEGMEAWEEEEENEE